MPARLRPTTFARAVTRPSRGARANPTPAATSRLSRGQFLLPLTVRGERGPSSPRAPSPAEPSARRPLPLRGRGADRIVCDDRTAAAVCPRPAKREGQGEGSQPNIANAYDPSVSTMFEIANVTG